MNIISLTKNQYFHKVPSDFNFATFKSRENLREIYKIKYLNTLKSGKGDIDFANLNLLNTFMRKRRKNQGNFHICRVSEYDYDLIKKIKNKESGELLEEENIKSIKAWKCAQVINKLYKVKHNKLTQINKTEKENKNDIALSNKDNKTINKIIESKNNLSRNNLMNSNINQRNPKSSLSFSLENNRIINNTNSANNITDINKNRKNRRKN